MVSIEDVDLPEQLYTFLAIAAILLGTAMCILPASKIMVPLFIIGFEVGCILFINLAYAIAPNKTSAEVFLGVGVVGGVLGGGLASCVLKVAQAVVALGASAALGYFVVDVGIASLIGTEGTFVVLLLIVLICLLIAYKSFDILVVLTLVVLGGFTFAVGLNELIKGDWKLYKLLNHPESVTCSSDKCGLLVFIWVLVSSLGLAFRFRRKIKKCGNKRRGGAKLDGRTSDSSNMV